MNTSVIFERFFFPSLGVSIALFLLQYLGFAQFRCRWKHSISLSFSLLAASSGQTLSPRCNCSYVVWQQPHVRAAPSSFTSLGSSVNLLRARAPLSCLSRCCFMSTYRLTSLQVDPSRSSQRNSFTSSEVSPEPQHTRAGLSVRSWGLLTQALARR